MPNNPGFLVSFWAALCSLLGQIISSCPLIAEQRFVCWYVLPCCLGGCGFGNHVDCEVSRENESMRLAFLRGFLKLGGIGLPRNLW